MYNNDITLVGRIAYPLKDYKDASKGFVMTLAIEVDSDKSVKQYYVPCFVSRPCMVDESSLLVGAKLIVTGGCSASAYVPEGKTKPVASLNVNVRTIKLYK